MSEKVLWTDTILVNSTTEGKIILSIVQKSKDEEKIVSRIMMSKNTAKRLLTKLQKGEK